MRVRYVCVCVQMLACSVQDIIIFQCSVRESFVVLQANILKLRNMVIESKE